MDMNTFMRHFEKFENQQNLENQRLEDEEAFDKK